MKKFFYSSLAVLAVLAILSPSLLAQHVMNIAGSYKTEWGTLVLRQEGVHIKGSYTHKKGTIHGKLTGRQVVGTWSQFDGSGPFSFIFSSDGRSFTGIWSNSVTRESGKWNGTKL